MINRISNGDSVLFTAAADYSSGDIVPLVTICGIAATDIANGSTGTVQLEGVYSVGKTTGEAWAVGTALYLVVATGKLTSTASTNIPFGAAVAAAASGDTTGVARLR
jgi:predicted RecA/RadA family phage recombinase